MRRHIGTIGLAVISLALAACGDDGTGNDTITTTGGSAAGTTVTTQELSDALLTAGDLGEGWTETQRDVFTTRAPENPSIDPSLWCGVGTGENLAALAGQEGADVELGLGPTATDFMVREQAWSAADVQQYFDAVKTAVQQCTGVTWSDEENNSYSLAPVEAPQIGDESISWKVTIHLAGVAPSWTPTFSEQTVARFGDVIMVLQAGATPTDGSTASAPNYTLLLTAAGDKIAALLAT